MDNLAVEFLLDSGAAISVVRHGALSDYYQTQITNSSTLKAVTANGASLNILGQVTIPITIGKFECVYTFNVADNLTVDCILGADCLMHYGAIIDCKEGAVTMGGIKFSFARQSAKATLDTDSVLHTVSVLETVVIPGRTMQFIQVSVPGNVTTNEVLIEQQTSNVSKHLLTPRTLTSVTRGCAVIQVMNTSSQQITLYKGTKVGNCTPVHSLMFVDIDSPVTHLNNAPPPGVDLSSCGLSSIQTQQLQQLLHNYADLFVTAGGQLGCTGTVRHTIQTSGLPIRQPMRRLPVALKTTVDSQVETMLQQKIIQPSCSPWSSPVVMVKKKNGEWRFCVDFRKLNLVTHQDAYPLPRIDATLDLLAGSTLFTTLDLASGYWQVELDPADKEKTAFSTSKGHFEFNVMPFGLTNAPATFQRLMECVLAGISGEQCLTYLDDIIVFSNTFQEHIQRLDAVLNRLRAANLKLRPEKCHFAQHQVRYLGHIISSEGVHPDPEKVAPISNLSAPTNTKQLKHFLGLSSYYRKFIQNYAAIAEPLYKLLRKNSPGFVWSTECQNAFKMLQERLITPPILAYPKFDIPFIVSTDASTTAIGAILSQVSNGTERVVAYWSRQLQKSERNYSTIEREALAIVSAIKEFYPYLYGFSFTIITDHNPLTSLKGLKDTGGRIARWIMFLQQFNFDIKYKKGSTHTNADALSRQPSPPVSAVIDQSQLPAKVSELIKAQMEDPLVGPLYSHLSEGTPLPKVPPGLSHCFLESGVLCRQYKESATGTIHIQNVIPKALQETVLREIHSLGHLGIKKTLDAVKTRFYWPGYEADVEKWIKQCDQCQKRNSPQPQMQAPLGTIQATRPFERISWDIMGPLPITPRGNKYILVVTDVFTKWVEAFSLADTTAITLANVLMNEVICRYGVPTHLHSDQGANLCSAVIQELSHLLGFHMTRSSAYHPEGNGQVERFNRTLEAMLAKVTEHQLDWDLYLPKVLFAYRSSLHETTGFTPYHLNFGRSPQLPIDVMLGRISKVKAQSYPHFVTQTHQYVAQAYKLVRQHLSQHHLHNKEAHDRKGTAPELQIGDVVWLYTPVVPRGNTKKFSSFWRGPYTIIDKLGSVNYKLQLIGGTQVSVVHRNRIKLCYNATQYSPSGSTSTSTNQPQQSSPAVVNTGVAGHASMTNDNDIQSQAVPERIGHSNLESNPIGRPTRNHRPPQRYTDFISH